MKPKRSDAEAARRYAEAFRNDAAVYGSVNLSRVARALGVTRSAVHGFVERRRELGLPVPRLEREWGETSREVARAVAELRREGVATPRVTDVLPRVSPHLSRHAIANALRRILARRHAALQARTRRYNEPSARDAIVRIRHNGAARRYDGIVVRPYLRFRGSVPVTRRFARDPQCFEAFDDAARRLATLAERWAEANAADSW